VSDRALIWIIFVGVATLAAILLWLRDRFRDLRHVPEAERKLSQQRNATGATAFVCLVWAAWFAFHAVKTAEIAPRIFSALVAMLLLQVSWRSYRQYRNLGKTK